MRYIVHGAGGIGCVVGARLHRAGHEVVLVARGEHLAALHRHGLRYEDPDGSVTLDVPAVERPDDVTPDDIVLLTVKSHQTEAALAQLPRRDLTIACLQNGVANEAAALRRFPHVYGAAVFLPVSFVEPGVVQAYAAGVIDVGRYPSGVDDRAEQVAADLRGAGMDALARPDIMRWKHGKLLDNLGNAVEALCGGRGPLARQAREEALAVFAAAGIDWATERGTPRLDAVRLTPVAGQSFRGGSTWQSLQRGAGSVETDYLNGEIVLLGRLHGVPTPVNAVLQQLMAEVSQQGLPPGSFTEEEVLARL